MYYKASIDGLRALSILLVLIYHYFHEYFPNGYMGVDIFFVISGFVITKSILHGDFSLSNFYFKRAKRLGPALIVSSVFALIIFSLYKWPFEITPLAAPIRSAGLLGANFYFWKQSNYFSTEITDYPFLPLWSLGVEEQFYLLFPLFCFLVFHFKVSRKSRDFVLTLSLFFSFALAMVLSGRPANFFLLPSRAWELLAGVLLAFREDQLKFLAASWLRVLSVFALALSLYFSKGTAWPGSWTIAPVLFAVCIIAGEEISFLNRILRQRILVYIGKISYPLYLVHIPALCYCTEKFGKINGAFLAIPLSFMLAVIIYQYIEQPLRHYTPKTNIFGKKIIFSLMPSIALVLLSFYIKNNDGFLFTRNNIKNYATTIAQLDSSLVPEKDIKLGIYLDKWDVSPDFYRSNKDPESCANILIGDSHAWSLYEGLSSIDQFKNEGLLLVARGTAPVLKDINVSYDNNGLPPKDLGTKKWVDQLLKFVSQKTINQANHIILAFMGPQLFHGKGIGELSGPKIILQYPDLDLDQESLFYLGLKGTIEAIYNANPQNRITFLIDFPELDFAPAKRLKQFSNFIEFSHASSVKLDLVKARQAEYRRVLAKVINEYPKVNFFDPMEFLCDAEKCISSTTDKLLYFDNSHLTKVGSEVYADALNAFLKQRERSRF